MSQSQNPQVQDAVVARTNNPTGLDIVQITGPGGGTVWRLSQFATVWYQGTGAPSTSIPGILAGNLYVDIDNGNIWKFDGTVWSAIGGSSSIPTPTPSTLGGIFSHAVVAHNFLTSINTDGTVSAAQPFFTDILGLLGIAQIGATGTPSSSTFLRGDGAWSSVPAGIDLQTNGIDNGSQTKLNLAAGSNVTLADNGSGTVTIAATGGGGGASFGRKVVNTSTYNTTSSDVGKALDVQTSGATTITLGSAGPALFADYGIATSTGLVATLGVGNVGVLQVGWTSGATPCTGINDSLGNTWTPVPNSYQLVPSIGYALQLFTSIITNGGSATLTPTSGSSLGTYRVSGGEFSNIITSPNPVDQSNGNAITAGSPITPSITTTAASEVLFGSFTSSGANGSASGSGWVQITNGLDSFYLNEYKIVTSTGTFSATTTGGATNYATAILSLFGATPVAFTGWVQNNSASTVTLQRASGLINGSASISLAAGAGCTITDDGTNATAVL